MSSSDTRRFRGYNDAGGGATSIGPAHRILLLCFTHMTESHITQLPRPAKVDRGKADRTGHNNTMALMPLHRSRSFSSSHSLSQVTVKPSLEELAQAQTRESQVHTGHIPQRTSISVYSDTRALIGADKPPSPLFSLFYHHRKNCARAGSLDAHVLLYRTCSSSPLSFPHVFCPPIKESQTASHCKSLTKYDVSAAHSS